MVKRKTHDNDKHMTTRKRADLLQVLVLSDRETETEGFAALQEGSGTHMRFVRRFELEKDEVKDGKKKEHFKAMATLLALSSGQEIDFSLVQERFRTLVSDAFPAAMADAISAKERAGRAMATSKEPIGWLDRWVPALFNRALSSARLVLWKPDGGSLSPGIFCPNNETGLYASLLIARSFSGLRACLGCGVLFPSRSNKLYHDMRCGDNHRHKRSRKRNEKSGGKKRAKI